MSDSVIQIVSLSGGKDSTATMLRAMDTGRETRFVFADTGNEHEATLEYVYDYLPSKLGVKIDTVKADFTDRIARKREYVETMWPTKGVPKEIVEAALTVLRPTGNPFLDLCLWKGRFPSNQAQFCTQELKRHPLEQYLFDYMDEYETVESWRGIRRDESRRRANAKARERVAEGYWVVHPIVAWTAQRTVDFVRGRGLELNPLYSQGMHRVGCMPCINVQKDELAEIARRFPEHIARIREWERLVSEASKRGYATFLTERDKGRELSPKQAFQLGNIDVKVEWSKTTRGGDHYDLMKSGEAPACASVYGLCE